MFFRWQMSGPWTNHQKHQIISIRVGILLHKFPKKTQIGSSEDFFGFILFCFCFCCCGSMASQAFGMLWILSSSPSLSLLILLDSLRVYKRLLPVSPYSHLLFLFCFIPLSRCWPSRSSSKKQVIQQSFGWSRRIWIPNHPPYRITGQHEKRLIFETAFMFIGSSKAHPRNPPCLAHILKEASQRKIHPSTAPITQSGKCDFTVQWLGPAGCKFLWSDSACAQPPTFRREVSGLLLLGQRGWKHNKTQ